MQRSKALLEPFFSASSAAMIGAMSPRQGRLEGLVDAVKSALKGSGSEFHWPIELEPFDEDEPPEIEIDHTDDDPGPETLSTGQLRPIGEV
jgi:hypothetical protein